MGERISKLGSALNAAEDLSVLPTSIHDDPERGAAVSAVSVAEEQPTVKDLLNVNLDEVHVFVPQVEVLFVEGHPGRRTCLYRIRNYMIEDIEGGAPPKEIHVTNLRTFPIPMSVADVQQSIIYFIDPLHEDAAKWLEEFQLKVPVTFRLESILLAIHENIANGEPDPVDVSRTNVEQAHVDELESLLRTLPQRPIMSLSSSSLDPDQLPPTLEVHKKFDDFSAPGVASSFDPAPLPPPIPVMMAAPSSSSRPPKVIHRLITENFRFFSQLLASSSNYVLLNEIEAKFFLFWAQMSHSQVSRVLTARDKLLRAERDVNEARTLITQVNESLAKV